MLGKAVRMLARGVAEKLKRSEPLDSPAIEVLLKDAWADLTSGNKVGAMEAVTKILANAPHHSDALHLHGILLYEAR